MEVKLGKIVEGTGKPEAQKEVDSKSNLHAEMDSKSELLIICVVTTSCGDAHRSTMPQSCSAVYKHSSRSGASCHRVERREEAPDLWGDWKSGVFPH